MFGSPVIEVALGLFFFYLLLSLGLTALNELLSGYMSVRSKHLKDGIVQLLQDKNRIDELYQHPLMKSLSKDGNPSYIPSKTFALSLLSTIAGTVSSCDEVCANLQENPDNPVNKQLLPLIQTARGDMAHAIKNVEEWFNNSMDRVAGWYKRWTMRITICAAAVVCILLNADTIMVAKALWSDPGLRGAVADNAASVIGNQQSLHLNTTSNLDTAALNLSIAIQQAQSANFPIGWVSDTRILNQVPDSRLLPWVAPVGKQPSWWFFKCLGILFTVLAVSLGAPFWFDLLSTFVKIRSSGGRVTANRDKP